MIIDTIAIFKIPSHFFLEVLPNAEAAVLLLTMLKCPTLQQKQTHWQPIWSFLSYFTKILTFCIIEGVAFWLHTVSAELQVQVQKTKLSLLVKTYTEVWILLFCCARLAHPNMEMWCKLSWVSVTFPVWGLLLLFPSPTSFGAAMWSGKELIQTTRTFTLPFPPLLKLSKCPQFIYYAHFKTTWVNQSAAQL